MEQNQPNQEEQTTQKPEERKITATVSKASEAKEKEKVTYMTPQEFDQAKLNQKLAPGLIAGIVAGVVCALLWAGIALSAGVIIGWLAVGLGLVVGFVIKAVGKGVTPVFGYAGAIISLLSCMLGNFLIIVGSIAGVENVFAALSDFEPEYLTLMIDYFHPIDVLFYALAIAAGYRYAFKKVVVKAKAA